MTKNANSPLLCKTPVKKKKKKKKKKNDDFMKDVESTVSIGTDISEQTV